MPALHRSTQLVLFGSPFIKGCCKLGKLLYSSRPTQAHLLKSNILVGVDRNQSRENIGHVDAPKTVAALEILYQYRKIKAQTRNMRERMGRIKGERSQHGKDFALKILLNRLSLLLRQLRIM